MAQVYRQLRNRQRAGLEPFFPLSADELAQQASNVIAPVSKASVDCGVAVFRELGLIETHTAYADGVRVRSVHVREGSSKVALTDSVRYREGLERARDIPRCSSRLGPGLRTGPACACA